MDCIGKYNKTLIDQYIEDELELIAVSKGPTMLLPRASVVRTNLQPLEQETTRAVEQ